MKFTEKMINDCYADFYDAVRPSCAVARAIQAFLKDLYDPSKKGEPEKNWLKPLTSTNPEAAPQASEAADAAARQDSAENLQIDRPAATATEPKAGVSGDSDAQALVVKKKVKKKEQNDKRDFEAYEKKNAVLDKYGSWLRFAEGPNGQWWCHFCHLHPHMRHNQDKLASEKTEVKKIGYFEKHENVSEIKFLLSHYSKYFHASEAADCLEQWERLKAKVMDCENLKNMQFGDLWPLLISQYTNNFEIILRLAVINLLFIMDNSQCERDFSLMNDLKGKFQHRMSHVVLRDRMWWFKMFKTFEQKGTNQGRRAEAIHRIGAEWNKAIDTKTGVRRPHTAEPIKEAAQLLEVHVSEVAVEATPDLQSDELMSMDALWNEINLE